MGTRFSVLLLALAALSVGSARAEECAYFAKGLDGDLRHAPFDIQYPSHEQWREGEGWMVFSVVISADDAVGDVWLHDAMGGELFVKTAAEALAKGKFDPPMFAGKPTEVGGMHSFSFRLEPVERGGFHPYFNQSYDRARVARERGDYADALRTLKKTMEGPLDLYELATMSYALAVTYKGLNDWRRALRHIRHATMDSGLQADKGVRAAALEMAVLLGVRDHDYRTAGCDHDALKEQYPARGESPGLGAAMAELGAALASTAPIATDVEILEQDRTDVQPHWWHPLLRSSFAFENVHGVLRSYRLDCIGHVARGPVVPGARIAAPEGVRCDLFVMGDPGAKFTLDER